jgi:hypothetical protein
VYTTIKLKDIVTQFTWLIKLCFQKTGFNFIQIQNNTTYSLAKREKIQHPRYDKHGNELEPEFQFHNADNIINQINTLVNNTFITFGNSIYQQIIGIPMGTNAATFLANLFCFSYEFDFMRRLIEK